jgi:hypothetical protein
MAENSPEIVLYLDTLLEMHNGEETEWERQAKAVLIPTPGHQRTYTEIQMELEAAGVFVPRGIKMLAELEQSPGGFFGDGHALRFNRDD